MFSKFLFTAGKSCHLYGRMSLFSNSLTVAISAGSWKGKIISGLESINFCYKAPETSIALYSDSSLFAAVNTQSHPGNSRGSIAPCY